MNADRKLMPVRDELTSQYVAVADAACARLAKNQQVRRNLPGGGRLRVDRQLPFLCLYRGQPGDSGTRELITTSAAYVYAPADDQHRTGLGVLCTEICAAMQEIFGTFLVIEVWEANKLHRGFSTPIEFAIVGGGNTAALTTTEVLGKALKSIRVGGHSARVQHVCEDFVSARGLPLPVAGSDHRTTAACCTLGLRVSPIYRDSTSGTLYPMMLQWLRWKLATALRKTIAHFTGNPRAPERKRTHHDTFGPSSMVRATRIVDQKLSEVAESFDFILQVTPMNPGVVWEHFNRKRFQDLPELCYRPLPYHPNLLKRKLFDIEIERVEDPTLAHLFWEKQDEVDRRLTALRDLHAGELTLQNPRQQANFLTTSLQLYGTAEDELLDLARQILKRFPAKPSKVRHTHSRIEYLSAQEVAAASREEIGYYQSQMSEFKATVEVSDSIPAGIMVSHDRLLIARDAKITPRRLVPLLHHEVGTHLLTYFNGRCQPFRQLYAGLAGYEELQEGLAVLAEYLVGGLTRKRLRMLAIRVLAVHWLGAGKPFASVLEQLHKRHGLSRKEAFTTTLRVFRGGGLTKDIIYLRGLRDVLAYLDAGHDIEPLYVGKIGLQHVPYIQELRRRGIIAPPRILPRFLDDKRVRGRLEACRGKSVLELMESD